MAYKRPFTIVAAGTVVNTPNATTSIPTSGYNASPFNAARLYLNVTAVSGASASVVVNVMGKDPNGTWVQLAQFNNGTGITATGEWSVALTTMSRIIRIDFVVANTTTPSFTVTVSGDGETYGD